MTTDRELAQCWRRDFPSPAGGVDVWILPVEPGECATRGCTTGLPAMAEPLHGPARTAAWVVPVRVEGDSAAVRISRIEPAMEPLPLLRYLCVRSFDSARALVRSGYFHDNPALLHTTTRTDAVAGALIALLGVECEPTPHVPWGLDLRWPGAPADMITASCAALRRVPEVVRRAPTLRPFVEAVREMVALLPAEDSPRLLP